MGITWFELFGIHYQIPVQVLNECGNAELTYLQRFTATMIRY